MTSVVAQMIFSEVDRIDRSVGHKRPRASGLAGSSRNESTNCCGPGQLGLPWFQFGSAMRAARSLDGNRGDTVLTLLCIGRLFGRLGSQPIDRLDQQEHRKGN